MAFDAFLKIEGVDGESADDKHKGWIEVLSYSFGVSQPASGSASTSGGATRERANFQDLSIVKSLDKASPKLMQSCASGEHFQKATLELCRSGGDKMKYMEYVMEQLIVSSCSQGGGKGGEPIESIALNYGKIKETYTQQKRADGSGGGNVTGGWDLTGNKKCA